MARPRFGISWFATQARSFNSRYGDGIALTDRA